MNLQKLLLTKNDCYKAGVKIKPCGIMVHSTGANNPWLKRYVGPDDGKLGKNPNNNHWNTAKPGGRQVCVHAFIGKLADGSVATYQTLPWDIRGWHSGYYSKASTTNANKMGYIGFEICEDGLTDKTYLEKVYKEAVELCIYLCKQYGLDPTKDGVIICHSEGHTRKIASNHGDVNHWWPKLGKTMAQFRRDVASGMDKVSIEVSNPVTPDSVDPRALWNLLKQYALTDAGASAVMANMQAESGLRANNLQNSYESKLGFTDEAYTAAVDSGKYKNFSTDKAGYGLCQWTYPPRKAALLKHVGKSSIGDWKAQVSFMMVELSSMTSVLSKLTTSTDVSECTEVFLKKYEVPASVNDPKTLGARLAYAKDFLSRFGTEAQLRQVPYKVRVKVKNLNIRSSNSSSSASKGYINPGVYTIVQEAAGPGATLWGKLKSGQGWISLDWTEPT